jgi:hypothetical protein
MVNFIMESLKENGNIKWSAFLLLQIFDTKFFKIGFYKSPCILITLNYAKER